MPTDPGGWGPVWTTSLADALVPVVSIFPFAAGAEHVIDVTVELAPGTQVAWCEGPLVAADRDVPIVLTVDLPDEIGATMASVRILVTAYDPGTGARVGNHSLKAWAWRDAAGLITLHDWAEGTTRAVRAPVVDGVVEEVSAGMGVAP